MRVSACSSYWLSIVLLSVSSAASPSTMLIGYSWRSTGHPYTARKPGVCLIRYVQQLLQSKGWMNPCDHFTPSSRVQRNPRWSVRGLQVSTDLHHIIPELLHLHLSSPSSSTRSSNSSCEFPILTATSCHPAGDLLAVIGRYTANLQPMPPALDPGVLGD